MSIMTTGLIVSFSRFFPGFLLEWSNLDRLRVIFKAKYRDFRPLAFEKMDIPDKNVIFLILS